jgi:hypothetical protein
VDPERAVQGDTIATLAARGRIRTLEEQGEYLENRGSRQRRTRANTGAAAEIAALGVKYQLASRETSFVAIEHRETPVKDRAELRRVPVALTSGWGGVDRGRAGNLGSAPRFMAAGAAPSRAAHAVSYLFSGPDVFADECCSEMESEEIATMSALPSRARRVPAIPRESSRPHDRLISLQRADGSWELDAAFAQAVSMTLRDLEKALRHSTGGAGIARRALATAVAIAWLDTFAPGARGEWAMLAEKARRWLDACSASAAGGVSWAELAERVLR